jgi:hypothetical protein
MANGATSIQKGRVHQNVLKCAKLSGKKIDMASRKRKPTRKGKQKRAPKRAPMTEAVAAGFHEGSRSGISRIDTYLQSP